MFESVEREKKKNQINQLNKSERISLQSITQLKMEPGNPSTYIGAEITEPIGLNTFQSKGSYPISGATQGGAVKLTILTGANNPKDLKGMDGWKHYENLKLLLDPSRTVTLIKMHAINGRFHGTPNNDNIALGTNKSNNSDAGSHYRQVELPICNFINTYSGGAAVYYSVTAIKGAPLYLKNRADSITVPKDKTDFLEWIEEACPGRYDCKATFYRREKRKDVATGIEEIKWIQGTTQTENIPLDMQ